MNLSATNSSYFYSRSTDLKPTGHHLTASQQPALLSASSVPASTVTETSTEGHRELHPRVGPRCFLLHSCRSKQQGAEIKQDTFAVHVHSWGQWLTIPAPALLTALSLTSTAAVATACHCSQPTVWAQVSLSEDSEPLVWHTDGASNATASRCRRRVLISHR